MTDEERSKAMDNLIAQDADLIEVEGMIRIGGFNLERPYSEEHGKIGIYRAENGIKNEGGDFDAAELEDLIAGFYEERF